VVVRPCDAQFSERNASKIEIKRREASDLSLARKCFGPFHPDYLRDTGQCDALTQAPHVRGD
jgi:hypothetical protein